VEQLAAQRQPIPRQLRGVELTDAQRTQIGAIMEASRDKTQALREELRELRDEHRDLLFASGETDAAKLQQVQSSIAAKEVELEKERVNEFLQIKALLTPEQQEQVQQDRFAGRGNKAPQKPGRRN
jgi:protein CpxP